MKITWGEGLGTLLKPVKLDWAFRLSIDTKFGPAVLKLSEKNRQMRKIDIVSEII